MSRFLNPCHQSLIAYTPGEQPRVRDLIKLNTNESPYPPSPQAVAAVSAQVLRDARLYCDMDASALRAAIGAHLGVDPDWVIAGNGSDEILFLLFLAYGARGAVFADITYGFYPVWARLLGVDQRVLPLEADFSLNPSGYMADDRLVVIANPNAPTGIWLELDQIEAIVRANPHQVVVVDEAYVDFGAQSAVGLTAQYRNLVVVQTFSKSRCLAGARLGFAVACPDLIADLNRMKFSLNPYNVNTMTQLMGAAAMADEDYFAQCVGKVTTARDWTCERLSELGFTVLPSRANFLFASPPDGDGARYQRSLREHKILVRRFDGPRTAPFVRISIGTQSQMERLVQVTRESVDKAPEQRARRRARRA